MYLISRPAKVATQLERVASAHACSAKRDAVRGDGTDGFRDAAAPGERQAVPLTVASAVIPAPIESLLS